MKKNTLAFHAENYPEVWYGIWSGPDVYNSDLSKYPGQTHFSEDLISSNKKEGEPIYDETFGVNWTDFPIMDLHPHAWPLYNTIHLIGAKFTVEGVELTPILPKEEYWFFSPILGFQKSKKGYSGWYSPLVEGIWMISLTLDREDLQARLSLKINDKEEKVVIEDGKITFRGRSKPNKPLRWEVIKY